MTAAANNRGDDCGMRWKLITWAIGLLIAISGGVSAYTVSRIDSMAETIRLHYVHRAEYLATEKHVSESLRRIEARLDALSKERRLQ